MRHLEIRSLVINSITAWLCCATGTLLSAQWHRGTILDEAPSRGPVGDPGAARGTLFLWSASRLLQGESNLNEPLVTDRPDFTEASSVVGLGVGQLEIGYTFTRESAGAQAHSFAEPLLRYGVFQEWLEFRAGWNYADETANGIGASGSEDLYLGFKIGLTPQEGILPEMAWIPQMTVPTGSAAFTAEKILPGINLIYGWQLSDHLSMAGSTQFNRAVDKGSDRTYTEWAQSWTFSLTLTDRCAAYTEWYAFFPHAADTARAEHYINGGWTILLSDDIQWDIRAGKGLNGRADDFFIGTGLSLRFR